MSATDAPEIYHPTVISRELLWIIGDSISNAPRSLQRVIGPSEIGMPCPRRLMHKLAQDEPPTSGPVPWLAEIGNAVHSSLAGTFTRCAVNAAVEQPRFLVEQRVSVGSIGGVEITGSADLFDIDAGMVIDWKIVGPTRLAMYRRKGPGQQYRTQVHLYGRGMANAGHHVRYVMIAFLPRNEVLAKAYFWAEPYDESVALAGLSRADGFHKLISQVGLDNALSMYPPCEDTWCPWCSRSVKPTSVSELLAAGRKSK